MQVSFGAYNSYSVYAQNDAESPRRRSGPSGGR